MARTPGKGLSPMPTPMAQMTHPRLRKYLRETPLSVPELSEVAQIIAEIYGSVSADSMRPWAYGQKDKRIVGSVLRALVSQNVLVLSHYAHTNTSTSHRRPIGVYKPVRPVGSTGKERRVKESEVASLITNLPAGSQVIYLGRAGDTLRLQVKPLATERDAPTRSGRGVPSPGLFDEEDADA